MPGGRDHVAIAAGSTFLVMLGAQQAGIVVDASAMYGSMAAAAVGSLAPDLDHPGSLASLSIPASLLAYGGVFLLFAWLPERIPSLGVLDLSKLPAPYHQAASLAVGTALALFLLSAVAGATFGHRGPVHSIVFGLIATAAFFVAMLVLHAPLYLGIAFAWGWVTHLVADATTPMGLPSVLWPIGASIPWSASTPAPPPVSPVSVPAFDERASMEVAAQAAAARVSQPEAQVIPLCPSCGVPMVRRVATRGKNVGSVFWGCRNFPRCRQIR
ncbi:MAG: metal-dependent hydrolase [Coriobacteriia bacterium]